MKMQTQYLGLTLRSPFIVGASPLGDSLDTVKQLEDAGAAAIVLRSLFEEQIEMEERAFQHHVSGHMDTYAEASQGFLPVFTDFALDTEHYLEHIRKLKKTVGIPVIASLNGVSHGGWERYSKLIEEAGADALELNFYDMPTDPGVTSHQVEAKYVDILKNIRAMVKIPLAAKISAFFSSLPNFAKQLQSAGADGMILFNHLYHSDIDIEELQVKPVAHRSNSRDLALRIRWLAILSSWFKGSLAASGGVYTSADAIKAIMAGATTVQMASAAIINGPTHFTIIENEVREWLNSHEYESLDQLRGSMNLMSCPDPSVFGRASYMRTLRGWSVL